MAWLGLALCVGLALGGGGCAGGCGEDPTPAPAARRRPAMPGITFVRGGVVLETHRASIRPWVASAPAPGAAQRLGDAPDAPIFVPVAWFPGQRFVVMEGGNEFGAAAPFRPWIYPVVTRRFPLPHGAVATAARPWASVAISPEGGRGAIAGPDGALEVFSLPEGQEARSRPGGGAPLEGVAFSLGGEVLYVVGAGGVEALNAGDLSLRGRGNVPGEGVLEAFATAEPSEGLGLLVAEGAGCRLYLMDSEGGRSEAIPPRGPVRGPCRMAVNTEGTRALIGGAEALLWVDLGSRGVWARGVDAPVAALALSPGGERGAVALRGVGIAPFDWAAGALGIPAPLGAEREVLSLALTHRGLFSLVEEGEAEGGRTLLVHTGPEGEGRFRHVVGPALGVWASPDGRNVALPIQEGPSAPKGPGLSVYDLEVRTGGFQEPTLHERLRRPMARQGAMSLDGLYIGVIALPKEGEVEVQVRVYR